MHLKRPVLLLKYTKILTCFVVTIIGFLQLPLLNENNNKIQVSQKYIFSEKAHMKYILLWTKRDTIPFVYLGLGNEVFVKRKCPITNCIVTDNKTLLGDYTKFDVIAFHGPEITEDEISLPERRSPHQKYVFASIESSDNYPVCTNRFDSYFNWTWSYRLRSDAAWGYMVVRDENKQITGPKINMDWLSFDDMRRVSKEIENKLATKTKAAAWFVSNCNTKSRRMDVVKELAVELAKYDLTIDVYGNCGDLKCPQSDECNEMLERDYFFYLSFENSFAEDYVTEKLLHPLKHLTVPIVYGGANYTRFMPDSAYLNIRELGVHELARKMNELIETPKFYMEYFRWTTHYSYHTRAESTETDEYCRFCSMLFEKELIETKTMYKDFRKWWDPPFRC